VSNQLLHLCDFCTGFAPDLGRPVVVLHRGKDGRALAGPRQPTTGSIQNYSAYAKRKLRRIAETARPQLVSAVPAVSAFPQWKRNYNRAGRREPSMGIISR
jgi:hypothetical protein